MRPLFAIAIVGFCAVLCLALALAIAVRRKIRRKRNEETRAAAHAPTMEVFEAGEFRTPRALRMTQEIAHPGAGNSRDDQANPPNRVPAASRTSAANLSSRSEVPRPARREPSTGVASEAVIIGSNLQFVPSDRPSPAETAPRETQQHDISGERKPPQAARHGTFRRFDLSHYNKDLGDLTDPYTNSVPGPATQPRAAKNG